MKQYQINKAYHAMTRLMTVQFPVRIANSIFLLSKQIEPQYEFAIKRERELMEKYNGQVTPDGVIKFMSPDDAGSFKDEADELSNMDVDVTITPITIPYDAIEEQTITPMDIAYLDGFVSFE